MPTLFRCASLIYGPELHHLDHLAPLSAILQIPLIVTDDKIAELARRYYPNLEVILVDYLALPEHLVTHYEILFYSMPRDLFDEVFFFAQKAAQKKIHTIWCPHGNSDKGNGIFYMEALKKEEAALLYGKQMIDFFKRKGVFDQLKKYVVTSNFRYQFYLAHKGYYDALIEKEIFRRLPQSKKTLLYAPTWKDYENSSSFFDATVPLIEKLPSHHNLIIKLHPNLILQEEFKIEEWIQTYQDRSNLLFLKEFPPIYPLLNIIDLYIGDMSSIGYDFLTFNRPLFFLNQNQKDTLKDPGLYLFRSGIEIHPEDYSDIHEVIERYFQFELRDFALLRKEVYSYAFGTPKPLNQLKTEIEQIYLIFPEPELNFF